ncbi:MAG: 50S ribosomal protein L6 [Candidatus Campbellbacteria bacterium]
MSRIGRQKITIPEKTTVTVDNGMLTVTGPKGTLTRMFRPDIAIAVEGGEVTLTPKKETKQTKALWGTYGSHIQNMIDGVNRGYEKKLILEGVGFRIEVKGKDVAMALGFSHPVVVPIPEGLTVTSEKNLTTISGIDKELVGQFAAKIRSLKKPEPYKGKGFRYDDEIIRRKEGKRAA